MFGRFIRRLFQSDAVSRSSRKFPQIPIYPSIQPEPITKEIVEVKGTNLIGFLRKEQRAALNKDQRWNLFDKASPNRIHAGSMIRISAKPNATAARPVAFTGVLLAIHRHPSEPTILVRTAIDGIGVEQKFCVMSPLIEKIEVIKPATLLQKHKLYMLRDQPALINKFSLPPEDQKRRLGKLKRNGKLHYPGKRID